MLVILFSLLLIEIFKYSSLFLNNAFTFTLIFQKNVVSVRVKIYGA
jgi:hypothetical protein